MLFVRVAAQMNVHGIAFKCQKLTLLKKFAPTPVHSSSPGYSRLVCPLSALEGNMTDGNKTTCRNMLLPVDNNRVVYLPTDICHIYHDVCYEQVTSLQEPKFLLYSCREMFCHTKKIHFDTHTNKPHFTESQNSGGQKGPLEIIYCKSPAQSRVEHSTLLRTLSSLWQASLAL